MMRTVAVLFLLILLSVLLVTLSGPSGTVASPQEPDAKSAPEELQEFVPSEEVPADSEVSFPVDI